MKPEINFMIHDWMFQKLELSGPRLLVCAFLFSARQNVNNKERKVSQLAKGLPICRRSALNAVNELTEKKILKSKTRIENFVKVNYYQFNEDHVFDKVFNNQLIK